MKVFVGALLAVVAALLAVPFYASWAKPIPRARRLADCTNSAVAFTFGCPPGNGFEIAIGLPTGTNLSDSSWPGCGGRVRITDDEREVFSREFTIAATNAFFRVNGDERVKTCIISFPQYDTQTRLDQVIKQASVYRGTVDFSNSPPANSSVWLLWRMSKAQARRR